jgi:hypothetical protein
VRGDVPVDSETLLVTDFMNLKIKLTQSFRCDHRGKVYVCVFIWISVHTYMSICVVCTVFLKKIVSTHLQRFSHMLDTKTERVYFNKDMTFFVSPKD